MSPRGYRNVGPPDLRSTVRPASTGHAARSATDLATWLSGRETAELSEPFTYIVTPTACCGSRRAGASMWRVRAGGRPGGRRDGVPPGVPTSGRWAVREVTDPSTGYCPDLDSWHAVARALDRAGIAQDLPVAWNVAP